MPFYTQCFPFLACNLRVEIITKKKLIVISSISINIKFKNVCLHFQDSQTFIILSRMHVQRIVECKQIQERK